MATKPKPNAASFFDRARKKPPELKLDIPTEGYAAEVISPVGYVVPDDKPKLVIAMGSGKTGKSTLLRWMAERATERQGTILATLAPNRTLKHYFPETIHPDGNTTSSGSQFLEMFLDVVAEDKVNAVLDFPGDDTALLHLLDQGADLVGMMDQAGVELVALYTLSPRVEDLTTMAQLAAKGFTPTATALILNEGITADPTLPAKPQFDTVLEHSACRAAIDKGAVPIWMPRLFSAKSIEDRRLRFGQAKDGGELGPSDRSRTHHWWQAMEMVFSPIASWLP